MNGWLLWSWWTIWSLDSLEPAGIQAAMASVCIFDSFLRRSSASEISADAVYGLYWLMLQIQVTPNPWESSISKHIYKSIHVLLYPVRRADKKCKRTNTKGFLHVQRPPDLLPCTIRSINLGLNQIVAMLGLQGLVWTSARGDSSEVN